MICKKVAKLQHQGKVQGSCESRYDTARPTWTPGGINIIFHEWDTIERDLPVVGFDYAGMFEGFFWGYTQKERPSCSLSELLTLRPISE